MDPYRTEPTEPQFVCVVCYRSLSVHAGECATCGVERLPLGDPEVRAEVRAEAERRLQKRLYGEWFWLYLAAWVVTTPVRFRSRLPAGGGAVGGGHVGRRRGEREAIRAAQRQFGAAAVRRSAPRLSLATSPATSAAAQKLLPAHADDPEDASSARCSGSSAPRIRD